jgi:GT2 family glycosyltransferase
LSLPPPAPAQPTLAAIVLSRGRTNDTLACLASLEANAYAGLRVIVVDYGPPGELAGAAAGLRAELEVLPVARNLGYAGNNNVGLRRALDGPAQWLLLINDDAWLAPDCLGRLLAAGDSDPRVGLVGPTVYHAGDPQVIQSAGGRLTANWVPEHLEQDERDRGRAAGWRAVDWLSGCALLARRAMVDAIGLLDERFFMYWEEVEWCLRAGRLGWQVLQVPQAKAWHRGGQRGGPVEPNVTYYSARNRFLVLNLYRAPARAWWLAGASTLRTLLSWSVRPRWRSRRPHRDALWQALVDAARGRWGARGGAA